MAVATSTIYNNFSYGMVSERMRRRVETEFYQNSARLMENLLPLQTGGFVLRPGTRALTLSSELPEDTVRIVPFVRNVSNHYIVTLAPKSLRLWKPAISGEGWTEVILSLRKDKVQSPTIGEIFEYDNSTEIAAIQYTQDNAHLILCSRYHIPVVLEFSIETDSFVLHPIELDTETAKTVKKDDGSFEKEEFLYDGRFTKSGNFPGTCAFCANRLWLGSTDTEPFKLWASQPFKYNNFQEYEWYSYIDETITTEQYLTALKGTGTSKEYNNDGSYTLVDVTVSPEGYVIEVRTEYDAKGNPTGKTTTDTYTYSKPATKWEKTITANCAMIFETGSDRDEKIEWINAYRDILIGTASSEWLIPWNIDALNPSIQKIGSYGAGSNMNSVAGGTGVFYPQSGKKRIRGFLSSSDGISFSDMNYLCPEILQKGIKEMHWQRVPYQRLYVVLNDGSIAVLCYEPNYGINAWVMWTFDRNVKSLSVLDDEYGQSVYVLFEGVGKSSLEVFDESLVLDHVGAKETAYIGKVISNGIDDVNTLATSKNAYTIYVDSLGTNFKAGIVGSRIKESRNRTKHDWELVDTFSPNTNDELQVQIESYPGEPFTVLAVKAEIGLGR